MGYMFYNCSKLSLLNLSNFDTSKIRDMGKMFSHCSKLSSLDLSNFDTSKVTNMNSMFWGCWQLTSLNLSNFDTFNVRNMDFMFSGCSQLNYLNLKNFIENNSLTVTNIFSEVPDNIVISLNENNTKILNEIKNKNYYNIDCSDNYNQIKIVNKTGICWDDNNNYILYKYEYKGIYYDDFNGGNLINNIQIKNCRCNYTMCASCPNLPLNDTFCNKCNNGYYQIENDIYNDQYFKCYNNNPIGYYLDINESIYKKCFYSFKNCEIKDDNNTHNCL